MKRILSIAFILLISNVQAQEKNKLSLEHYKNYEWTSNPKLSPDGQQILYSRSWINMVDDKRETDLWIMNKDGSTNRFFLNGSNGKWSPNGDKIAFTKKGEPNGTQILLNTESRRRPNPNYKTRKISIKYGMVSRCRYIAFLMHVSSEPALN